MLLYLLDISVIGILDKNVYKYFRIIKNFNNFENL